MNLNIDYSKNKIFIETKLSTVCDNLPAFANDQSITIEADLTDDNVMEAHSFMLEQQGKGLEKVAESEGIASQDLEEAA